MARYRKVDSRIWNDEKFSALSESGKLVFFLLLTHPHMTALGAMRASLPGLAAEIGWKFDRFCRAFDEVSNKGMVKHDDRASMVWLPKFLRYNGPENPNVVKSWEAALDLLPECALKRELVATVNRFVQELTQSFQEALPESFRKSMAKPEPEPEPEPIPKPLPGNSDTTSEVVYPAWLDRETWNTFKQHRREIRKPLTRLAESKALERLKELLDQGEDQRAVIDQSIVSRWAGLFPVKEKLRRQQSAMERSDPQCSNTDAGGIRCTKPATLYPGSRRHGYCRECYELQRAAERTVLGAQTLSKEEALSQLKGMRKGKSSEELGGQTAA